MADMREEQVAAAADGGGQRRVQGARRADAIDVDHRAPTPIGQKVIAEAVLERIDGRFFIYRVTARNEQQPIGSGTVHRAVVNVRKFMEKTKQSGDRVK